MDAVIFDTSIWYHIANGQISKKRLKDKKTCPY